MLCLAFPFIRLLTKSLFEVASNSGWEIQNGCFGFPSLDCSTTGSLIRK